jgi:hypothetical protein
MASTRLRVYKPRAAALEMIVNYVDPDKRSSSLKEAIKSGFKGLPTPIEIGTVRYTSTARLHRADSEPKVAVRIQPSDFLARRTAVLGMTRTGKSNTVKTTVASVKMASNNDGVTIGQLIFDINGEYANANHQDDGSSIAEVFVNDTVRYRAVDTPNFEDLRMNFYLQCAEAMYLLNRLAADDPYRNQTDLQQFLEANLEPPDKSDMSATKRWEIRRAIAQAIFCEAGFVAPSGLMARFPVNKDVVAEVAASSGQPPITTSSGYANLPLKKAVEWFKYARSANLALEATQKAANANKASPPKFPYLPSSSGAWVDPAMRAFLNVLARENDTGTSIRGFRAIVPYIAYHSAKRQADVIDEIHQHLLAGRIVILDLSAGPVEVRTVLSERIARQIFERSMTQMNAGQVPPHVVLYIEEAHNLIGRKDELTRTWPRIAKEGAKARIALVYATQEPSSIHPNILANTENWFVTHLNNDDELRSLGKFYDFADFQDSLKAAQDVGFARIKTLSSPFVIPTQIHRFTPSDLKTQMGIG